MDTLVTAQWLKQHINDSDLVVLDCTVVTMPDANDARGLHNVSGRPDYELGHIPNARAPLIKSIMLLRDLKGTVARRKAKLMAESLISFATRQMCPSDRARRGLQACPCSALAFFTRYLHAFKILP